MAFRIISEFVGPSNASGFVQDACGSYPFLPTGGGSTEAMVQRLEKLAKGPIPVHIFLSSLRARMFAEQASQATTQTSVLTSCFRRRNGSPESRKRP